MPPFQLKDGTLYLNDTPLLSGLPETLTLVDDPQSVGVFLRFTAEKPLARHIFALGDLQNARRLTFGHRYEPYWMKAAAGTKGGDVLPETQHLLVERTGGDTVLFAPLVDGPFRAALQGNGEYGLELVAETGDPSLCGTDVVGLFLAADANPYELMERAAPAVMARMQTGRLRRDKALPAFMDQFGWCTWDAFYQEVSHDKIRRGLESFARGGVQPKLLILDDGWQSTRKRPSGEQRLTAFAANERFGGDLTPTVQMAKGEFGVQTFVVWHAFNGYWGGVDEETLTGYDVRPVPRRFSPGILHHMPTLNSWWGGIVGLVPSESIYRFFQDYHRHLRLQGVDGVKVDTQATLEGIAYGAGGRVSLMQHYHAALEGSVHTHFQGRLINCMSCASEMLYGALNSSLTRTSTDFWPDRPDSHGLHLYVNAQVSAWWGEFVHPDWDMFQSGHAMGAYHAMGRAVGGCPVYVSDKPDQHNFAVLRKLVLWDGSVLRAKHPGRPTRDCLFHDPTREDVLLKIFNHNLYAGVVGVFNAQYKAAPEKTPEETAGEGTSATGEDAATKADAGLEAAELKPVSGHVSPADIEGLEGLDGFAGDRFAVYAHHLAECRVMARDERWEIAIPPLNAEVFTIVPVENGVAPIGLADMYNSAGALLFKGWVESTNPTETLYEMLTCGGGRFLIYTETPPLRVEVAGSPAEYAYDEITRLLTVDLPPHPKVRVRVALKNT
jgi:raffinose synthase